MIERFRFNPGERRLKVRAASWSPQYLFLSLGSLAEYPPTEPKLTMDHTTNHRRSRRNRWVCHYIEDSACRLYHEVVEWLVRDRIRHRFSFLHMPREIGVGLRLPVRFFLQEEQPRWCEIFR